MPADQIRDILTEPKVKTFETNRDRVVRGLQDIIDMIAKANDAGKGIEFLLKNSANYSQQKAESEAATAKIKEMQEAMKLLKLQIEALTKARMGEEKIKQEGFKSSKTKAEADKAETTAAREKARAIRELVKEQEQVEKKRAKEEVALKKSQSAYNTLKKQYNETAEAALNLGAEIELLKQKMGQTAAPGDTARLDALQKEFDQTSASANSMNGTLLKLEQSVGRSQRNVGNYKAQWDGLNMSIQQIVREFPSVANNWAMLPLALSNQIGPVIDNYQRLIALNKQLIAEGKAVVPVWKQVAGSIFSWQTALMAGVALLVAYTSSAGTAAKKTGDFAEAFGSATTAYAEAKFELEAYKKAFEDTTTSMASKEAMLEHYNKTWGDQAGHLKNVGELENFLQNKAQAFIDTLFLRAKATAALSAATELLTENLKNQANFGSDLLTFWDQVESKFNMLTGTGVYVAVDAKNSARRLGEDTEATTKKIQKLKEMYGQFSKEAADMAKANGFDLDGKKNAKDKKDPKQEDLTDKILQARKAALEAIREYEIEAYERNAAQFKQTADDEKAALEDRLAAYQSYYNIKDGIIDEQEQKEQESLLAERDRAIYDIEQSTASEKQKAEAIKAIQEKFENEAFAMYAKFETQREELSIKATEDQKKITETSMKEQLRVIMQGAQDIENEVNNWQNDQILALNAYREKYGMTDRKFNEEYKRIQQEGQQQLFEGQKTYFTNTIDELERNGKLTKEIADKLKKELAGLQPGKASGTSKGSINDILGLNEEGIREAQGYVDAVLTIIDSIGNAVSQQYQNRIDAIERERELSKEKYDQDVEFINSLSITDEERQKRLADLKARNTLKELDQQRRINDAKRRQARAEKTANIAETVGKTAIAIMNALSVKPWYLGVALAAAAGISGAAQLSAISSQPIPQYAKGRGFGKSEFAVVNEKGPEAIVSKSGQVRVANEGKPGLTYLAANEMVMTAEKTRKITDSAMLSKVTPQQQEKHVTDMLTAQVMDKVGNKIVKAVKESRSTTTVIVQDNSYINKIIR